MVSPEAILPFAALAREGVAILADLASGIIDEAGARKRLRASLKQNSAAVGSFDDDLAAIEAEAAAEGERLPGGTAAPAAAPSHATNPTGTTTGGGTTGTGG